MVKSNDDIQNYTFESFSELAQKNSDVKVFEFKTLETNKQFVAREEHQQVIRREREISKEKSFKINEMVEEFRGLKDQETREYEERIEMEVRRRVEAIQDEAFKAGFEEGALQGREEVFEQMRSVVDEKLEDFNAMISSVLSTQEQILMTQKKEMYTLLRSLSKWIILRELKEDGKYVERLLERILHEMQSRSNLLIQVNADDFAQMEDVLAHLQLKLGELKNVRVEVDSQIPTRGIVVESENGIINATMEEQFKSLDKLFEDVLAQAE